MGDDKPATPTRRFHETEEQLDEHLMKTALKELKYRSGTKFTILNEIAFQREFLLAHNKVRARYGCQPLSWNQLLADEARIWADHLLERGMILYKDDQEIGQNIALLPVERAVKLPTGTHITELWAKQADKYDFSNPSWSEECQNFTQLVWKATDQVGCCRSWSPKKHSAAIVAFYRPSGNGNNSQSWRENMPQSVQNNACNSQ